MLNRPLCLLALATLLLTTCPACAGTPGTALLAADGPDRTDAFLFSEGPAREEATIRLPYDVLFALSDTRVIGQTQRLVDHHGMALLAIMSARLSPEKRKITFGFGPRPGAAGSGHARFHAIVIRVPSGDARVESVSAPEFLGTVRPSGSRPEDPTRPR